ncbi:hypothetical protein OAI73_00940 [Gammaproteobacteria bacterium]|nr:hypothetical protein [Gammaproteobacteria bacterium]
MNKLQRVESLPLILSFLYCLILFYIKALVGWMFSIELIDGYQEYLLSALIFIFLSLFPFFFLLYFLPFFRLSKPLAENSIPYSRGILLSIISLILSISLVIITIYTRGSSAISDFYGNRILIEHGIYAPLTIMYNPVLVAIAVIWGMKPNAIGFVIVLFNAIIWGVFFSKGFILVYTLLIYFGLRNSYKNRSYFRIAFTFVFLILFVVFLGRLRSGGDLTDIIGISEFKFLLTIILHRVDQLDSFVLVMAQQQLEYSLSLGKEIVDSVLYTIPRFIYEEKPESFSMEMTKNLRPLVYAVNAANNFTVFSQFKMLFGWYAPLFLSMSLVLFFSLMGLIQRLLFQTRGGFLIFVFAMIVPCFMTIISSGIFRDYIIQQFLFSMAGLIFIHFVLFKKSK